MEFVLRFIKFCHLEHGFRERSLELILFEELSDD